MRRGRQSSRGEGALKALQRLVAGDVTAGRHAADGIDHLDAGGIVTAQGEHVDLDVSGILRGEMSYDKAGDALIVENGCVHQHLNDDPNEGVIAAAGDDSATVESGGERLDVPYADVKKSTLMWKLVKSR